MCTLAALWWLSIDTTGSAKPGRIQNSRKKPDHLKPIRKPPFYAFWGQRFTQCTHGGIVVNENTEVLDKNGRIIPGLFAGGDGTSSNNRGGGGIPGAVNSGYVCGIVAGEYVRNL